MHKSREALPYLTKSLHLLENTGDKKGLTDVNNILGNAYEEDGKYTGALACYEKMILLSNQIGYKEGLRDAYEKFSLFYKKQKQFEKALEYTLLFNSMKDSLLNKENFKQVSELNTRYETDKKEKEILLLTKDQQLKAKVIKQQQLVRWGLIIGLILLFISVFSIWRRYRFKQKANLLLQKQKKEIQEKNVLITDSIDYAKSIQEAVFPSPEEIKSYFTDSFLFYKPKSVVSGDFYWIHAHKNQVTLAVADCTGHGVPGAFMSLLGYNMLENEIKNSGHSSPAGTLDNLNTEMVHHFSKNGQSGDSKHGMDITVVSIDTITHQLQFAGAHHTLYIIRSKQLIELKGDKRGVGLRNKAQSPFTNLSFTLQKGDMIYAFTDGFPDQIGGENRKKFYYPPFKELLLSICELTPEEQQKKLDQVHIDWMGSKMDQTDDILIIGIRYT